MAAAALKSPTLEISEEEAERLGKAAQDVAAQYNHVIDPKTAAWIQLGVVSVGIYGPRIAAGYMQKKHARENPPVPAAPVQAPEPEWPTVPVEMAGASL